MTTLTERPKTALLVIDVQNNVMAGVHNRNGVIANISFLVDKARSEKVPLVWVQHSGDDMPKGSDGWLYVPELTQEESEPVVHKQYGDSCRAQGGAPDRRRGADRRLYSVHTPRGDRPRLRRDARRRRPHHRRSQSVGRPNTRQGHRPYEPILAAPDRSRTGRRDGEHRFRQIRLRPLHFG